MIKQEKQKIGAKIRQIREEKRLNRHTLADRMGKTTGYIYKLEEGYGGYRYETLKQIADALDVDVKVFYDWREEKTEDTIFTIQPGSISDGIRKAKVRSGITKKGRTHLLRHTLGVNLINNGYDLKEVQYILGHKTLYMTNLYTQIVNAKIKKKFDTFQYEISEK